MKKDNSDSIESVKTGLELLCKALDSLPKVVESIASAFSQIDWDAIARLPDNIKQAGETWASFGWVPLLPSFEMGEYADALTIPSSEQEANQIMMSYFNDYPPADLFSEVRNYIVKYEHNLSTYDEAVKSFDYKLFTSCALNLFAVIDCAFLNGQKKKAGARQRDLSSKAIGRLYDEKKSGYLVNAVATKKVIESLFERGNDFPIPETGLNRNYLSHGMNKYIPNETDCLKLFVLLYNVYILFDSGHFDWKENPNE